MATSNVTEARRALESGLLSIEHAARTIEIRADDGLDADQVAGIACLIAREAARLQEELEQLAPNDAGDTDAAASDMTADDFSSPQLMQEYELFLSLLVVAGGRDRMKALRVRKAEGVDAAIAFLEECPITGEADHGESAENADESHDTPESAAYRRGHRHGLHQATLAIQEAVNTLHPDGADR